MAKMERHARIGEALLSIPDGARPLDIVAFVHSLLRKRGEWNEEDHPRGDDGKFTDGFGRETDSEGEITRGGGRNRDNPEFRARHSDPSLPQNDPNVAGPAAKFAAIKMTDKERKNLATVEDSWRKTGPEMRNPVTNAMEPVTPEGMAASIEHWYSKATPEQVEYGKVWYEKALEFNVDLHRTKGAALGLSLDEVTAMTAACSIQNLWNDKWGQPGHGMAEGDYGLGNQLMVNRILDYLTENKTLTITPDEAKVWEKKYGADSVKPYIGANKVRDLPAQMITFFAAPTGRDNPWGGLPVAAEKAFKIYAGNSISASLGEKDSSKLRSFYVNMRTAKDPDYDDQDVTLDSWAHRQSTNRMPVGDDKLKRQQAGIAGTKAKYTRLADIYREGAKRHGLQPKQYQAIGWKSFRDHGESAEKAISTAAKLEVSPEMRSAAKERKRAARAEAGGRKRKKALAFMVLKEFDEHLPANPDEPITDEDAMLQTVEDEFWFRILSHLRGASTAAWDDLYGEWDEDDDAILDALLEGGNE